MCGCLCTCVCMCTWRHKVDVRNPSWMAFLPYSLRCDPSVKLRDPLYGKSCLPACSGDLLSLSSKVGLVGRPAAHLAFGWFSGD